MLEHWPGADKEIVTLAVTQNGNALQYASEELRKDKEVVFLGFIVGMRRDHGP